MFSAPEPAGDVTALLIAHREGNEEALRRLWPEVYDELHRIAQGQLRRGPAPTLSTTALVHEVYLKLVDGSRVSANDRLHFFALAARAMRHVLIDRARARSRQKRGGRQQHVPLDEAVLMAEHRADALLALDEALDALAGLNERLARVVECRFYGGMTEEEIGALLGISARTVRRDWRKAKAFLWRAMTEGEDDAPE